MKFIILMYHIIDLPNSQNEESIAVSPPAFRSQMEFLYRSGYNVISLETAVNALDARVSIPDNSIVITFDDGFKDTYETAFPILLEFNFSATVFVVSDLIGTTNKWMDSSNNKSRALCTWDQLGEMAEKGITIGSHTKNHVNLNQVSEEIAHEEILKSKEDIQANLGVQVDFFAYPYGFFNDQGKNFVASAGYKAALTTNSGFNYTKNSRTDPFMLRRLDIYSVDTMRQFKRKIVFGANKFSNFSILKYYGNQLLSRFWGKKNQNYV